MQKSVSLPTRARSRADEYQLGTFVSRHKPWYFYPSLLVILILFILNIQILTGEYQLRGIDTQLYTSDKWTANQNTANCQYCSAEQKAQVEQNNINMLGSDLKDLGINKYSIKEAWAELGLTLCWFLMVCIEGRKSLYIYSEGLLFIGEKKASGPIRWDEISEIHRVGWCVAKIRCYDRSEQDFTQIWRMYNAWKISKLVEKQTHARLLTRAKLHYALNGNADFGAISLNREGLSQILWRSGEVEKCESVAWNRLEDIRLRRGAIFIKTNNQWQRWSGGIWRQLVESRQVANPTVCVALAQEILKLGAW